MLHQCIVAVTLCGVIGTDLIVQNLFQQTQMWESFKREYGRNYKSQQDESQRFSFFLENLKIAELRNLKERQINGTAVHGVTKFSDLSQAEFE